MGLFNKKAKNDNVTREEYYSNIDSQNKAIEQFKKKNLCKLFLFPLELGGADDPRNIVYVPDFVLEAKASIDSTVLELLQKNLVEGYSCSPEYKGNSFIPSKLNIHVTGQRTLDSVIDIW